MSKDGIHGMRAAGDDLLDIASRLTEDQWQLASTAAGWSIKDVFVHLGSLLELLQGAVSGAAVPDAGIEELNDRVVSTRRDWTPAEATKFLQEQLSAALGAFTGLQNEPVASTLVPMLDLGTYPLHAVADMFSFDMTTHLRYDILAPLGPIHLSAPALDETRLRPAVSWLIQGLSQMQADLSSHLLAPISLELTGPGHRQVLLTSDAGVLAVSQAADATVDAIATVTSTTVDFLGWSTQRMPWNPLVHISGDRQVAEHFLNALNLV
jgi:uncharacterized protein (TIGR03083 family)